MLVPFVELHKLLVVAFGEGSLGGDVDDQGALLPFHEVAQDVLSQVDVFDYDRPELADDVAL